MLTVSDTGIGYRHKGSKIRITCLPGRERSLMTSSAVWKQYTNKTRWMDGHQPTAETALMHSVARYKVRKWTKMSEGKLMQSCAMAVADLQQNILCDIIIKQKSKAKMCNGRRHVPLCPASANEKFIVQKCNYNTMLSSVFI